MHNGSRQQALRIVGLLVNPLDPEIDYRVLHLIVRVALDSEALLKEAGHHEMAHVIHDSARDRHKLIRQNSCVRLEVTILMLS